MKEIFEALQQLQTNRPEAKRSNVWHAQKIMSEESGEFFEVVWNNPTPDQLPKMLEEGSDVIMNVLFIYLNSGISPEVARQALIDKIDELGNRPVISGEIKGLRRPEEVVIYDP